MSFETLLFEKSDDKVATITINRPEALNSFNRKMCEEFHQLWAELKIDDDVNAVVLRAAPGRAFCTGVDVKQGYHYNLRANPWERRDPSEFLSPKQNRFWKPVICAVHGLCGGGAFYWVNEVDIVICSEDAQFFDPHVTFGMTAAVEPVGLARRIPLGEVLRITLMGNDERISAQTALRIGLVSEVTANEQLWARAHEIAAIVAAKPSAATQGSVRAIWESLDGGRQAALSWALPYTQLGNAVSAGRAGVTKPKVTIR